VENEVHDDRMKSRRAQIQEIEAAAASSSRGTRNRAAIALGRLDYSSELAPVLRRLLLDEKDTGVTVSAAQTALEFSDADALAVLVEAYRDGEEETRWHIAIQVAGYVGDALTRKVLRSFMDVPELGPATREMEQQLGWDLTKPDAYS
jgi:HEAT repeat protein